MSMAEEMACLARKIVSSYEARVSSVVQIVETTQEMLETFRHEREAMRTQLRRPWPGPPRFGSGTLTA